jgi:hypothetical protein
VYDPTIHSKTISRHFRPADFVADKNLLKKPALEAAIADAVKIGHNGFTTIALMTNKLRQKNVYQVTDISQKLVLRHVTNNIKRVTNVKQDDRAFIVSCLKELLSEGVPFRLYKFDIKSFYESVEVAPIIARLRQDIGFSRQSVRTIQSFFDELSALGITGLPRGLALSATLSEYLLRPFDKSASGLSNVWFFARFVDDIVIVTDGRENALDFTREVSNALPNGLIFNSKSKFYDFTRFMKPGVDATEHKFSFLGYQFDVGYVFRRPDKKLGRSVYLDISSSKISKIKTRIVRTMLDFQKNGNYPILLARIRLLTSNFNFEDRVTGAKRSSGIYFNYPMIDAARSTALRSLDKFLRNSIMSSHPKNTSRPNIATAQRRDLAKLTFTNGYCKKRFYAFGPKRLAALTACWSYA